MPPLDSANWAHLDVSDEALPAPQPVYEVRRVAEPAQPAKAAPPTPNVLSRFAAACRRWLEGTTAAPAQPPKPKDARVLLLEMALQKLPEFSRKGARYRNVVQYIHDQATSPAVAYGVLEALRDVTGHPVHNLGYKMQPRSRYSCDTSCMTEGQIGRALTRAIKHVQADPTRSVS